MPRAVWKGAIAFGLVHVPVSMYPASQETEVNFDWLDKRSLDPVGSFSVPFYGAIPANIPANRAATDYRTRPDYSQRYLGFEVAAIAAPDPNSSTSTP